MNRIYLDDIRTPLEQDWIVVRNLAEFSKKIQEIGLENISHISLDHDLDKSAMDEYFNNVVKNYTIDYSKIIEPTGLDCVRWIVDHFYKMNPKRRKMSRFEKKSYPIKFPEVVVHSHNPIGSGNMMGYINNFYKNEAQEEVCVKVKIPYKD
jgi:hypothetical protein